MASRSTACIIFLFDDDDEGGHGPSDPPFGGGRAFAESHPWMKDVRLVVGMDTAAWGVPHVLQTSDDDGLIVRGYADGVDDPMAFGFGAALTNGEFETFPFRERGLPAIEIEDNYPDPDQHTARDAVADVEQSSVQGMGNQALGLARAYGDMDLTDSKQASRVFHTIPAVGVVHYPAAWSAPLALVALLAYAMVAFTAIKRHRVRGRRLLAGAGWAAALLIATVVLATLAAARSSSRRPFPPARMSSNGRSCSPAPHGSCCSATGAPARCCRSRRPWPPCSWPRCSCWAFSATASRASTASESR